MKQKIIDYVFLAVGIFLVFGLVFRNNYHHKTASDYQRIIKKLHITLPEISDVESSDNYDRGASRWDCLEHTIKFAAPLPEKTTKRLDRKATRSWKCPWNKWYRDCRQSSVFYIYRSEKEWESDSYFYQCIIEDDLIEDNDSIYIEYYIDEDEVLFNVLKYIGLLIIWAIAFSVANLLFIKNKCENYEDI
jgi:hypothetical protein